MESPFETIMVRYTTYVGWQNAKGRRQACSRIVESCACLHLLLLG
jgi:hypothetical protein